MKLNAPSVQYRSNLLIHENTKSVFTDIFRNRSHAPKAVWKTRHRAVDWINTPTRYLITVYRYSTNATTDRRKCSSVSRWYNFRVYYCVETVRHGVRASGIRDFRGTKIRGGQGTGEKTMPLVPRDTQRWWLHEADGHGVRGTKEQTN